MSSRKKINGVIVGVAICCLLFLGFQYFMAHENGQTLMKEDAYDRQTTEEELESLTNTGQVDDYIRFVSSNEPDKMDNYTQAAYTHLISALESLADQQEANLASSKVTALQDQFLKYENIEATEKPDQLKALFMATTNTLQSIDLKQDDQLKSELDKLQEEAEDFDVSASEEELLMQEEEFFKQAATVLEAVKTVM